MKIWGRFFSLLKRVKLHKADVELVTLNLRVPKGLHRLFVEDARLNSDKVVKTSLNDFILTLAMDAGGYDQKLNENGEYEFIRGDLSNVNGQFVSLEECLEKKLETILKFMSDDKDNKETTE